MKKFLVFLALSITLSPAGFCDDEGNNGDGNIVFSSAYQLLGEAQGGVYPRTVECGGFGIATKIFVGAGDGNAVSFDYEFKSSWVLNNPSSGFAAPTNPDLFLVKLAIIQGELGIEEFMARNNIPFVPGSVVATDWSGPYNHFTINSDIETYSALVTEFFYEIP